MSFRASSIFAIVPRPVHRVALVWAQRLILLRHHLFRRPAQICSMIVQNENGEVLLVRHSYRLQGIWTLPTARIGRRENPVATAQRELEEEVSCSLENAKLVELENATSFSEALWDERFQTFIVDGSTAVAPTPDLREIEAAAFFPLAKLPRAIDELAQTRLERWKARKSFPIPVPAFVRLEYLLRSGANT